MSFNLMCKSSACDITTPQLDTLADEFTKELNEQTGTSTTISISIAKKATECLKFVIGKALLQKLDWEKGTFTWRLNVVTANTNLAIVEVILRRIALGGGAGSVKSSKSSGTLNVSLGTTGIKKGNIPWTEENINPSGKDMTDRLEIVFKIHNSKATAQTAGINTNTSSELLTIPIIRPFSHGVKIGGFW